MADHSEYIFSLEDIRDLVNALQVQGNDHSVSITLGFTHTPGEEKVFSAKVKATIIDSTGQQVGNIFKLGCPRPPGCP
ncbi:hypothetical protein OKW21_002396 [Catalinimonas alkaloidigena]|uniref:hypothetical protein n=1 Tax=Catalinimonas alkaloidigena TaxID=1075417 RepID=UPI0024066D28|nr:hypothetical protein [Catalinimonas alkaloidigena]MDF9797133.1 hypothetical protein [Catalinimonas alkaloidigena]